MDKFFPEETVEYAKTQAFDYKAPEAGDHNNRHSAKFESILRDGATKADYREWRLLSEAFVNTQAELKILESSVRDSLINALGAHTRQAVLAQFGSKLSSKRVSDLIHYLDMRYSFMASVSSDPKVFKSHHYSDEDYKDIFYLKNQSTVTKYCTKHRKCMYLK